MRKDFLRKTGAAVLSAAMAISSLAVSSSLNIFNAVDATKYEFEDATLTGCTVQTPGSARYNKGASGDSFVFLEDGGESAAVTVNVETAGAYTINLCYSSPYGDKSHNFYVNGVDQGQFSCPKNKTGEWFTMSLGSVKLNAGDNEIKIVSGWGWTNIDYITVETATYAEISASQNTCSDPKATKETKNLMSYLASIYGKNTIAGQQEIYANGPHGFEEEFEYINNLTGHYPAIRGFDYGNFCCPAFGSDDGSTDRVIDWVKNRNGIATASFHLNVPTDFASYTIGSRIDWSNTTYSQKTDFSPSKAATEGTKDNQYYMEALTILAKEFKELEAQGVPVIWRPLHEAEGGGGETGSWFWWGREGSEAYKKLWIYTYKTLTETFDCHNLIWEWNSYPYSSSENWYPGDEYVDIIGYDKYNCTNYSTGEIARNDSAISSTFYNIMEKYGNKKMVSMAETDSIPALENLTGEKAGWLYIMPWYDGGSEDINFVSSSKFNTKESLTEFYQSDYCITLDELPADLYSEVSQFPTADPNAPTAPPTTKPEPTTDDGSFKFEQLKYPITLEHLDEQGDALVLEIKGAPTASIGGGFGFADGEDWTNIEWSGNADSDGKLIVEIPLDKVPSSVTGGEVQIWWSNVWDSQLEEGIDQPCELVDYTEVFLGCILPTEPTTTTVPITSAPITTTTTTAPTTTTEPVTGKLGDADGDGEVTITDAVCIMSYATNKEAYPLSSEALSLCDVSSRGDGISNLDALAIQKLCANVINELPESYME